jgi:hypothetical protein
MRSLICGVAAFALLAGPAVAEPPVTEGVSSSAAMQYEVDEDRDGRPDRTLMLEQSDSLA